MDEKLQILLTKGVESILPNKDFLATLLTTRKVTVYAGFDPTAPTLHIGHTIQLRKLRHFQDLGHKIVFLIGDFTARIGDPTDKNAARKQLTEKEIKHNLRLYKRQASRFIRFNGKNAATIKYNSNWLRKLRLADILELSSLVTVDQMLKRDMFVRRMAEEKPIYIHEFFYPLMQGYDSVAMDVDGEIGGSDQLFNMLMGRTLLKQIKNKEKFVLTLKLLEDGTGKKMGKSEGNMISLIDTPVEMYGKIMRWPDSLMVNAFELCTDYTPKQVLEVSEELSQGMNPRDVKMKLAYEIVRVCTNEKEAQYAQEAFVGMFQKDDAASYAQKIDGKNRTMETILIEEGIVSSKSEVRRLVEAGAVRRLDLEKSLTVEELKTTAITGTYKVGKTRIFTVV